MATTSQAPAENAKNIVIHNNAATVKLFDLSEFHEQDKMYTVLHDFNMNSFDTISDMIRKVMQELPVTDAQIVLLESALRAATPMFCTGTIIVTQNENRYLMDTLVGIFGAKDSFMKRLQSNLEVFPKSMYESSGGHVLVRLDSYDDEKKLGKCKVSIKGAKKQGYYTLNKDPHTVVLYVTCRPDCNVATHEHEYCCPYNMKRKKRTGKVHFTGGNVDDYVSEEQW